MKIETEPYITLEQVDSFLLQLPNQPFFTRDIKLPITVVSHTLNEVIELGLAKRAGYRLGDGCIPKEHDPRWWWTYKLTDAGARWLQSRKEQPE